MLIPVCFSCGDPSKGETEGSRQRPCTKCGRFTLRLERR